MIKLRERSHVLLWILLFFFIMSMMIGGLVGGANIMSLIFGSRDLQRFAGQIGGNNITHQLYRNELDRQLNQMRSQGQQIDNRLRQNAGDFAWNALIDREVRNKKIKALGLETSLDEIYDFLLNTPPSGLQAALNSSGFFATEDGKFDLNSYQEAVNNGTLPVELDPLLRGWENGARTFLANRKLQYLYNQLGSISDNDVKMKYMKDSLNCTLDYIYLTISSIPDSLIEVNELEVSNRYEQDKKDDLHTLKDRISVQYVLFNVPPPITGEDSLQVIAVEDSVLQLARDFIAEADYSSFNDALSQFEITKVDTIDIHETFEANSGIPFQMGVLRPAVRFAFDNSIGTISDPITAKNGIAVFHSINKKNSSFKPLDEVKESIRRTLTRENKKDFAKNFLREVLNSPNDWEALALTDSLLQFSSGETQNIGGSFPGIGKSNQLTGALLASETGEISSILETYNAVLLFEVVTKDIVDEGIYQSAYSTIRSQLLNTELSRGYTSWLTDARKLIDKEDYRSEIY